MHLLVICNSTLNDLMSLAGINDLMYLAVCFKANGYTFKSFGHFKGPVLYC